MAFLCRKPEIFSPQLMHFALAENLLQSSYNYLQLAYAQRDYALVHTTVNRW